MSENLFGLSSQAITGKHKLQTATANLVPQHGGADTRKQGGAYFGLYLSALEHGRGAGYLNARTKRADDIDIDGRHGAEQRFRL